MKKMMKYLLALVFVTSALMPLGIHAESDQENDLLTQILDRKELVIGTSPDYPPYEFIDTTKSGQDQYVGSDMEMARYIANELGVKLVIKPMDFDAVLASLSSKQIDLAIAGLTYTPERAESMQMSDQYYDEGGEESWQGVLINKDKQSTYTSLAALAGKKIAVQKGSLQEIYTKEQLKDSEIQYVSQLSDAITLLNNGSVDAVASSYGSAKEFAEKNDGLYASTDLLFELKTDYLGVRIGMPKGEERFATKINEIIKKVSDEKLFSGWYQAAANYDSQKIEGNLIEKSSTIFVKYLPMFAQGLAVTLGLAFVTVLFGTILGAILALIKLSKNKLVQFISTAYVELIRGTPLLLQLWLFVICFSQLSGGKVPMIVSVIIALVINSSAYVAEIIRGGIQSVDKGQSEAAKSLGMSNTNMMKKIILPQAVKTILPSLGNEFIMMVKETSLASCFYIGELMTVNNIIKTETYLPIEPLLVVGLIYFVVTFTLSKIVSYMEGRMALSD